MLTREELQGHWNQVKGQIQERWGEITNDELREVEGNTDQLVGLIQQKPARLAVKLKASWKKLSRTPVANSRKRAKLLASTLTEPVKPGTNSTPT